MKYVLGVLAGLAWGALAAFVNLQLNKVALKKNTNGAVIGANMARMVVDLIALGSVYLLRKVLPFSFEAALIATAISLSILAVVFAYMLTRPEK